MLKSTFCSCGQGSIGNFPLPATFGWGPYVPRKLYFYNLSYRTLLYFVSHRTSNRPDRRAYRRQKFISDWVVSYSWNGTSGGFPWEQWRCRHYWKSAFPAYFRRPRQKRICSWLKTSINTSRKSPTRFPTSLRWSPYVAPESPKGGYQKRKTADFRPKSHFAWRKSVTQFLCVKTVSDNVVRHSLT